MAIQQRSYYAAAEQGRQDKQASQINLLAQKARQQQLDQDNILGGLMANPETTPEQFTRAGRSDIGNSLLNIQRRPQEEQAAQAKQFAEQMHMASQYALTSKTPKALIEKNFPFLVEAYGPEWATATDDQVRSELEGFAAKFGVQAGIKPPATQKPNLINTIGPDGKPVRGEDVVGAPVYERPRFGTSVTMPDGTSITIGGDGVPQYGGVGLDKPNHSKLQEAFINAQGNSYALREQLAKYRQEFSTFAGRAKAGVANAKEMVGLENAPQQQQFLNDFTAWKSDTNALLSAYLNQLSGAAISPHEEVRLKGGFPNADDGPTQYKAKAEATMRRFALVQARAAYLLSNPSQSLNSVSLDSMGNIIALEANRLAKSLQSGGMTEEQAKQEALARTHARYFGGGNGQ